jgi:hypothetical protein
MWIKSTDCPPTDASVDVGMSFLLRDLRTLALVYTSHPNQYSSVPAFLVCGPMRTARKKMVNVDEVLLHNLWIAVDRWVLTAKGP